MSVLTIGDNNTQKHIEKKKFLEKAINDKIQAVLDLRKMTADSVDQSDEYFSKAIDEYYKQFLEKAFGDKLPLYQEIKKLEEKQDELLYTEQEERREEWQDVGEQKSILIEKLGSGNILFFYFLEKFVEDMKSKKKLTSEMFETLKSILDSKKTQEDIMLKIMDTTVVMDDDFELISTGVGMNIILSKKAYEKAFGPYLSGAHISSTNVSYIKKGEGQKGTLNHENNHNLADTFSGTFYIEEFLEKLERDLDDLSDKGKSYLKPFKKFSIVDDIARYWQRNNGEIIADIDRLPEGYLSTFRVNYSKSIGRLKSFINQKVEEEDFKQELLQEIDELDEKFIKYLNDIGNIFYVATRIGKVEEAKALFVIYSNDLDSIRKIERHMKTYTLDYDNYVLSRSFIHPDYDEFDIHENREKSLLEEENDLLDSIFGMRIYKNSKFKTWIYDVEALKKLQNFFPKLSKEDKKKIMYSFESSTMERDKVNFKDYSLQYYIEAYRLLENIVEQGDEGYIKDIFIQNLFEDYSKYIINEDGDFTKLVQAFQSLDFDFDREEKILLLKDVLGDCTLDSLYEIKESTEKLELLQQMEINIDEILEQKMQKDKEKEAMIKNMKTKKSKQKTKQMSWNNILHLIVGKK